MNANNGKGNLSESKVLTAFIQAGFIVSLPFGGAAPYDFIVDVGLRLLKVQVKTGRLRNGCVLFPRQRFSGHTGKGRSYAKGEIDIFAVYCPDNGTIYVLPLEGDLTEGRLRCGETRNNQKQKVRWAKNYELEVYLRGLGAEVMELVGFEPTTS
jgi:hypothetical protein